MTTAMVSRGYTEALRDLGPLHPVELLLDVVVEPALGFSVEQAPNLSSRPVGTGRWDPHP